MDRVHRGEFERDPAQEHVVLGLQDLATQLAFYRPTRKSAALGWLMGQRQKAAPVRGVYIWGSVGRGKTALMDMFFEETQLSHKRRVHFHSFMADVHERIFAFRQQVKEGRAKGEDPIVPVAEALANESWLLCLDEFAVTDIADAMILARLFKALFEAGVVVVATSNVAPRHLYSDGLNRSLFLPFIDVLDDYMDVVELNARTDFRLEKLKGEQVYHVPADAKAYAALTHAFAALTGVEKAGPATLEYLGRSLRVPQAKNRVARFSFADLCAAPLGARDFLEIAENFHTIMVDDIPIIGKSQTNEAKRFILLIDALYDQQVKLLASAAAEPHELYVAQAGREAFEFSRTVSRLMDMRSAAYLALPHGRLGATPSGLAET
ncbi:MAG: cell division protein ZapE [Methylovirgula sp.]|nr:cell division protein ZapE [Methylovirgula sp.]